MRLTKTQGLHLSELKTGKRNTNLNNSMRSNSYRILKEKKIIREMFTHYINPNNGRVINRLIGWKIEGVFYKEWRQKL